MSNYDFTTLSPIDFEILTRDLLQQELEIRLESFKSGRDQGIDFRYCSSDDRSLVIQCKHCPESSFPQLLRRLREEKPKVHKLKPDRYILVISIGLTPLNKNTIYELFSPYIKAPEDIITRDDLNNLLGMHPQIERQTFKLWLSSVSIFEKILHSESINISQEALERILIKSKYYVQTKNFKEALNILEAHGFCIIAGIPGIGKTILAEMLCLYFLDRTYELVKISGDISEAYSLYHKNKKIVYYYDDFLGQTSVSEKLNKNEDQMLLDFMDMIARAKVSKLILTTREYILNQAKRIYEKLERGDFGIETCVIDLSDYSRFERAQILFNHLYFSDIPREHKDKLLAGKDYLEIIDHENYNPRIIDLMTAVTRVRQIDPDDYVTFFLKSLDNPSEIWSPAFESQLSQGARNLLLVLTSMPAHVFIEDLERAFQSFHCLRIGVQHHVTNDFRPALKELDGNFIAIAKSGNRLIVRFHNPSIKDFLQDYLAHSPADILALIQASTFFEQLMWLWQFGDTESTPLQKTIFANPAEFAASLEANMESPTCRLIDVEVEGRLTHKTTWDLSYEARVALICRLSSKILEVNQLLNKTLEVVKERINQGKADRQDLVKVLEHLKQLETSVFTTDRTATEKIKEFLISGLDWFDDIESFCDFVELFPEVVDSNDVNAFRYQIELGFGGYEPDSADIARQFAETLRAASERLEIDLEDEILRFENITEHLEAELPEEPDYHDWAANNLDFMAEECSDDDIHSLFSLIDD